MAEPGPHNLISKNPPWQSVTSLPHQRITQYSHISNYFFAWLNPWFLGIFKWYDQWRHYNDLWWRLGEIRQWKEKKDAKFGGHSGSVAVIMVLMLDRHVICNFPANSFCKSTAMSTSLLQPLILRRSTVHESAPAAAQHHSNNPPGQHLLLPCTYHTIPSPSAK